MELYLIHFLKCFSFCLEKSNDWYMDRKAKLTSKKITKFNKNITLDANRDTLKLITINLSRTMNIIK